MFSGSGDAQEGISFLRLEQSDWANVPLEAFSMSQAANQHAKADFTVRMEA